MAINRGDKEWEKFNDLLLKFLVQTGLELCRQLDGGSIDPDLVRMVQLGVKIFDQRRTFSHD